MKLQAKFLVDILRFLICNKKISANAAFLRICRLSIKIKPQGWSISNFKSSINKICLNWILLEFLNA